MLCMNRTDVKLSGVTNSTLLNEFLTYNPQRSPLTIQIQNMILSSGKNPFCFFFSLHKSLLFLSLFNPRQTIIILCYVSPSKFTSLSRLPNAKNLPRNARDIPTIFLSLHLHLSFYLLRPFCPSLSPVLLD